MIKIAIVYQKETKLLEDIRKKIRKEAYQSDNISAIYEYSTIEAFHKANERSLMDIVFLEDTIDNCGLTTAKYIRETGQETSLYFFGTSINRAFYGYEYKASHYLTEKEQVESLNIYQHFFGKYFPKKTIFLFPMLFLSVYNLIFARLFQYKCLRFLNQDFIIDVIKPMIYLYRNKNILCVEKELDTLQEFLWNMGRKEIL